MADIVLVELCWALAKSYGLARIDIARTVRALLDNASIALESPPAVRDALARFETGSADFPDCLIVAKASGAGCKRILSFDRGMGSLPGVESLSGTSKNYHSESQAGSRGAGRATAHRRTRSAMMLTPIQSEITT